MGVTKRQAIADKITDELIRTLDQHPEQRQTRQRDYRRRAQDLRTLVLMQLVPDYATDALAAYAGVAPELVDKGLRAAVLKMLAKSYEEAADSGPQGQ